MSEIILAKLLDEQRAIRAWLERGAPPSDFDMVGDFHAKFGLPVAGGVLPSEIPAEAAAFRLRFVLEEVAELARAYGFELEYSLARAAPAAGQALPAVFDALIDIAYVALGTAHFHGFPWAKGFAEVQRANMAKERAAGDGDGRSVRKSALDVVKPAGWKPPDVAGVLLRAGWKGPRLPE